MLKFFVTLLLALSLLVPWETFAAKQDIVILYTNDIHCGIEDNEGMARLAQYKKDLLAQGKHVVLVDAGDAVQGTPLGKLSDGKAIINVMNSVGYDFAIPGNHEFDYGMEAFARNVADLACGYHSANFKNLQTGELVLPAYKIVQFEDVRIALLGVTTPETLSSSNPKVFQNAYGKYQYSFCEDTSGNKLYNELQKAVDEVRTQNVNYVVLVAHLGMEGAAPQWSSTAVAANVTGVDVIIDAHSHEQNPATLAMGKNGKHVIITQSGTKLQNIGQITFASDGKLSAKLVRGLEKQDEAVANAIAQEKAKFAQLLEQVVGEAEVALYTDDPADGKRMVRNRESNLGNFVADALRAVTGADVAIYNGGGIRSNLPQGAVTYNDVFKVLPFINGCVVKEVTGQQLLDALEMGAHKLPEESGGFLQVAGLTYTVDTAVPTSVVVDAKGNFIKVAGEYRVKNVNVKGEPINLAKLYSVASNSYILLDGGNGMSMFENCKVVQNDNLTDLDAVLEYLQNHLNAKIGKQYANPYGEGRITIK